MPVSKEEIVDNAVDNRIDSLVYYIDGSKLQRAREGLEALKEYRRQRLVSFMASRYARTGIDLINEHIAGFERAVERLDSEMQMEGAKVKRGRKAKKDSVGKESKDSEQSEGQASDDGQG